MSPKVLGITIPKKKRRTSKSQHLAYTGEEPDWVVFMQSNPNTEAIYRERTRSYDWYNYYHKSSSLFRDIEKWLVDNKYTKDDIKAWKAAEAWRTTMTVASSCKLLNNGMPDIIISPYNKEVEPKPISDHIKKSLKEVIEIGYKHLEEKVEDALFDSFGEDTWFLNLRGETTKTGQSRQVVLPAFLQKELTNWWTVNLTEQELIETGMGIAKSLKTRKANTVHHDKLLFPYKSIKTAFNKARDRAGLGKDITFHSLRHHFCSKALASGVPIQYVKHIAGHASITTTEIYYGQLPKTNLREELAKMPELPK